MCILLGIFSWQRQNDAELLAARQKLEKELTSIVGQGTVRVNYSTLIQVKRPSFNDDDLAKIAALGPRLEAVNAPITVLDVSGTQITDRGASALRDVKTLEACFFVQTRVTDSLLDALRDLPKLKVLCVTSTGVTAAGRAQLSRSRPDMNIEPPPTVTPKPTGSPARR